MIFWDRKYRYLLMSWVNMTLLPLQFNIQSCSISFQNIFSWFADMRHICTYVSIIWVNTAGSTDELGNEKLEEEGGKKILPYNHTEQLALRVVQSIFLLFTFSPLLSKSDQLIDNWVLRWTIDQIRLGLLGLNMQPLNLVSGRRASLICQRSNRMSRHRGAAYRTGMDDYLNKNNDILVPLGLIK